MKLKILPVLLAFLMLVGCAASTGTEKEAVYHRISMSETVKRMENEKEYILLDVRRPDEFAADHIPNAINVPNESIGKARKARIYKHCGNRRYSRLRWRGRNVIISQNGNENRDIIKIEKAVRRT